MCGNGSKNIGFLPPSHLLILAALLSPKFDSLSSKGNKNHQEYSVSLFSSALPHFF